MEACNPPAAIIPYHIGWIFAGDENGQSWPGSSIFKRVFSMLAFSQLGGFSIIISNPTTPPASETEPKADGSLSGRQSAPRTRRINQVGLRARPDADTPEPSKASRAEQSTRPSRASYPRHTRVIAQLHSVITDFVAMRLDSAAGSEPAHHQSPQPAGPPPQRLPVNPRRHKVAPEHRKRVATA
ncbi:hypothetical protein NM208_g16135 [Fusarium decemcellulare]|uniref:Uncharacterized protein n=1 Tax=Fusarium decemcellulare TaxID=57161 RepID=A0ACC1RCB4_9HYPO|nr:hypothetical protein NM208_g16135 [Fusarium decemcellulare]